MEPAIYVRCHRKQRSFFVDNLINCSVILPTIRLDALVETSAMQVYSYYNITETDVTTAIMHLSLDTGSLLRYYNIIMVVEVMKPKKGRSESSK